MIKKLVILVVSAIAVLASVPSVSAHSLGADTHAEILTDDTFDNAVFPSNLPLSHQRPYIIMFYAPWCGHCKQILPVFNNASRILYTTPGFKWATDSARFAIVDATANTRLGQQFKVKAYPTFFYTINGRAFRYGGALTVQDLATNAVFLYQGFSLGSFADDITTYNSYRSVANSEVLRRPLFVVCRPTRSPPNPDGVPHDFNTFVDSVLMQGRPRFGQFIEDEAVAEERPTKFRDVYHKQYWNIKEACTEARADKNRILGPAGEILLVWSDKSTKPIAYNGPWSGDVNGDGINPFISIKGSSTFRTSKQIALWVWENSYNGVEKLSTEILAGLTKRGRVGIFVTEGDVNFRNDKKYLPALHALSQRRTAAYRSANPQFETGIAHKTLTKDGGKVGDDFESATMLHKIREQSPIQIAVADAAIFGEWIKTLGYTMDSFPKFFVFDSLRDTIWRIEEWLPTVQQSPDLLLNVGAEGTTLAADGPEIAAIAKFLEAIETPEEAGGLRGVPTTTMGLIARYVTDYVPFSSKLSAVLGDDPILFLTVIGCGFMFLFVIIVSFRRSGEDEDVAALKAHQAAKAAKKNEARLSSSTAAAPSAAKEKKD